MHINKIIITTLFAGFLLTCGNKIFAQDIFDDNKLHEIRLQFSSPNWYDTLAQYYTDALDGSPKKFLKVTTTIDGETLAQKSGIRFKGEYSYTGFPGRKKPFRIHFNKFNSQNYQGIKKINLHNLAGDPSFLREFVSYDLLRKMGIAASRTAFTKLYINDVYWGCYLIVEEPEDKRFLKDNFGNDDGNLFEAASTTRLNWKGADPAAYTELKLQTDDHDSAWTKLLAWLDLFNNNFSYNFQQQLAGIFDTDEYFKILAADVFLNNWDSYSRNGRNFFVYDDPETNRIRWVPWDYNLAMWKNDLPLFPTDANSNYDYKPLIWRIKENKQLKQTYYTAFCHLLNNDLRNYDVETKTLNAYNVIRRSVEDDTLKFYSNDDFHNNRTGTVVVNMLRDNRPTDVTLPGITALFASRKISLRDELLRNGCNCDKNENDNFPELYATIFPNPTSGNIAIYIEQHPGSVEPVSLQVYNMAGQKIKSMDVMAVAGKYNLDISSLPAGTYYCTISSAGRKAIKRIVKL